MSEMSKRISEFTHRDVLDARSLGDVHWSARVEPIAFLNRIFVLSSMPFKAVASRMLRATSDIT